MMCHLITETWTNEADTLERGETMQTRGQNRYMDNAFMEYTGWGSNRESPCPGQAKRQILHRRASTENCLQGKG